MKIFDTKKSTQELIGLGMALHGDKDAMETRIRGVFSRRRSARIASVAAAAMALVLAFACFTTACQPVTANGAEAAAAVSGADGAGEGSLLQFGGFAQGTLDGNRITVTDAKGTKYQFTWVDEGLRKTMDGADEPSAAIPEGAYVTPGEVALRAAETAVTVFGDAVTPCEIHINMYTGNGLELVYYGIGFGGTPFESAEQIYGYADAVTGTILTLDANYYGRVVLKYGDGTINDKIAAHWNMPREEYEAAHTSEKALATAMELIRTCFPTGKIVPRDADVWDAGSHTDGAQILWAGGYEALVDAYVRMDQDPCYYVQVAVPLDEEAEPCITIFGCYPLGWDYCCNQIHDPAVLREELADLAAIRSGILNTDDGTESADSDAMLNAFADQAEALLGTAFTPMAEDWKPGDDPAEYAKLFLVRIGAYLDDGYEDSDPTLDPARAAALARRGNVLRLEWNGQFLYAIYLGDGQMIYADAATMTVCQASLADWMQARAYATCSILIWR